MKPLSNLNQVIEGDCLELLRELPDSSVDSIVTDPPYGLSFMGKKWDYDVPAAAVWVECLRVLKPGGHLLAFAGTRTQHRMAVNIEDAGFEIRDMIAWVYGSGMPKSHNISKAIDKAGKASAKQWDGWGTSLKPALEPITVARKPFKGSVAANVLEHGTGAINIDGCRIAAPEGKTKGGRCENNGAFGWKTGEWESEHQGRWPANLIHDGSEEVTAPFPVTSSGGGDKASKGYSVNRSMSGKNYPRERGRISIPNKGNASRFFYCAKASKKDRGDNAHPTVKPTDLMRYLCRLVTPPGGIVLDPYTGSGSTGKAAILEGFKFIGFEREAEYCAIARQRISDASPAAEVMPIQSTSDNSQLSLLDLATA